MKKVITIIGIFGLILVQAQVGINTDTPQATLDIKSEVSTLKALKITNSANTEIVTVTDDGKVGIGTNAPTHKLEVYGTSLLKATLLEAGGNDGPYLHLKNHNKTGLGSIWRLYNMTGSLYGNALRFIAYDENVGTPTGLFSILDNGNVGIGVGNPLVKLDVDGIARAGSLYAEGGDIDGPYLQIKNTNKTGLGSIWRVYNTTGSVYGNALRFNAYDENVGTPTGLFSILDNGNVGIGVGNPLVKLDVNGISKAKANYIESGGVDGPYLQIKNTNKTGLGSIWRLYNMTGSVYGNALRFYAYDENVGTPTGLFSILDNGNVGIGVGNPLVKLDVNGISKAKANYIESGGVDGPYLQIKNTNKTGLGSIWRVYNTTGSVYGNALRFSAYDENVGTPTGLFSILDNGNVGIGVRNPLVKLEVSGNIKVHGVTKLQPQSITANGTCESGSIGYGSNGNFYGCKGGQWKQLQLAL